MTIDSKTFGKIESDYYDADKISDDTSRNILHEELLEQIHETYVAKNKAYGNSFDRSIGRYGFVAALVRMEDKLNRLEQLLLNGAKPNDESAIDTCLDLANYAIMTAMKVSENSHQS